MTSGNGISMAEAVKRLEHPGVLELRKVMGRAPGADLTEVQEARARRIRYLQLSRRLKRGQAWAIATGQEDDELGFLPASAHASRPKGRCKECSADITGPDATMKSDPARCKACRKRKKQQYNVANRGRV
ncbi:hypothetical protein LCGC14_1069990 [marine sediment metagenome]|uniref:Uncharacterized protein n=1 Tax=marine sediment metagenome TaxID=412755 RepID=A0A0F9MNE4_9ZZZZ